MSPKAALDPSKDRPSIYKALIFLAGRRIDVRDSLCAWPGSNKDAPAAATASEGKRFTIESDLALSKMSLGMTAERTGDVDQDFVAMMTPGSKNGPDCPETPLPLCPNQRTSSGRPGWSGWCQQPNSASET
jgi:hypothetical protein